MLICQGFRLNEKRRLIPSHFFYIWIEWLFLRKKLSKFWFSQNCLRNNVKEAKFKFNIPEVAYKGNYMGEKGLKGTGSSEAPPGLLHAYHT